MQTHEDLKNLVFWISVASKNKNTIHASPGTETKKS